MPKFAKLDSSNGELCSLCEMDMRTADMVIHSLHCFGVFSDGMNAT